MERLRTVGATHTDYRVANGSEKSLKIREFEIWSGKSGGKALNFDKIREFYIKQHLSLINTYGKLYTGMFILEII